MKKGICYKCKKPKENKDKPLCKSCNEKVKEYNRKRYIRLKEKEKK